MKKLSCVISFLLLNLFSYLQAQQAVGSWNSYLSYHNATQVEPAGNIIYAVGNGGLFSYDKEDESVTCYSKDLPLSDTEITNIGYDKSNKTLVIVYSNYNIDLLVKDNEVYNLPDYKEKNMTQDKTINSIMFDGDYAYLSTSFGIIAINLKRKEISNTYFLNKKVNGSAIRNNQIYAATNEGLFTALLTENLLDVNNWKKVSNTVYQSLSTFKDELIGNIPNNGIVVINKDNFSNQQLISGNYHYMYTYDDRLIAGTEGALVVFTNLNNNFYLEPGLNIKNIGYENGTYWAARGDNGLSGFKISDADRTITMNVSSIIPDSPKRNLFYTMNMVGDRLLIAGGGINSNRYRRVGTAMMMENNNWTNFQEEGIREQTGLDYLDITSIAQDPTDDRRHYVSSAGEGVYEFYDGKFLQLYNEENSSLESAISGSKNYVRTNGLIYDKSGNLFVANMDVDAKHNIHLLTPQGKWIPLLYSELNNKTNLSKTIFDRRGNLWLLSTWQSSNGVFCVNMNGTPENISDDQHKFVSNFYNQDGTRLNHEGIYSIAEDQNGAIWIGTGHGPIVLNNPSRFFDNDYYCTQIKVPRNDGTNLADFLLANDQINDIVIDGGNRKWLATESNGLYLLSADGLETIHHFTEENSPLPSNTITALSIHPKTGVVYIGTMKGLVSYQGDAPEGEDSFEEDKVYAYPNPVHPGYTGNIVVTGLMRDSNVKITNISGKLIYEGTSTGGQFTWDGRNMQGNRVASGVYFVLAADAEGKEGIVTKIMFVR